MLHLFVATLTLVLSSAALAKLNVVTTTSDLASLVEVVGGDKVALKYIVKGTQHPHHIEAKPSFLLLLRDADLLVLHGLDLESSWVQPLLQNATNPRINPGGEGYLEIGPSLDPIEKASGPVSRAEGDVHPEGNPHFQVDPVRMGQAAILIGQRLGQIDKDHKDFYMKNASTLRDRLALKAKEWSTRIAKTGIKEVVTYHKSLTYFLNRFHLASELQLEPKPGIPPSAAHVARLIAHIKTKKIKLVLIENWYDDSAAEKLKSEIEGLKVIKVPVAVGGGPAVNTTEQLVETLVQTLESAK